MAGIETREEKQTAATILFWMLAAERLRDEGLLSGGPRMDRERAERALRDYAAEGITPDESQAACNEVIGAVQSGVLDEACP